MLDRYRSGRHADALAAYRAHADRIVEPSGLQPSPALRALELRIRATIPARPSFRAGDPSLDLIAHSACQRSIARPVGGS